MAASDGGILLMSPVTRDDERVATYLSLALYEDAVTVLCGILAQEKYVDSWKHWDLLHTTLVKMGSPLTRVVEVGNAALALTSFNPRGPRLALLRVCVYELDGNPGDKEVLKKVLDQVTAYYGAFNKLVCCAEDLEPSVKVLKRVLVDQHAGGDGFLSFLRFERSGGRYCDEFDVAKHKQGLRRYITSVKLLEGVFGEEIDKEQLLVEYEHSKQLKEVAVGGQKEVQLGDELVIMVVIDGLRKLSAEKKERCMQLLELAKILKMASW